MFETLLWYASSFLYCSSFQFSLLLKSESEREALRQQWDFDREVLQKLAIWERDLGSVPTRDERLEMKQKIEEQLRNKESTRDEL